MQHEKIDRCIHVDWLEVYCLEEECDDPDAYEADMHGDIKFENVSMVRESITKCLSY